MFRRLCIFHRHCVADLNVVWPAKLAKRPDLPIREIANGFLLL